MIRISYVTLRISWIRIVQRQPINVGIEQKALVQFNWGAFQDCYGLPSSPIFDKKFGPDFNVSEKQSGSLVFPGVCILF